MVSPVASSDPIRAEVERRLAELADVFVVRPLGQAARLAHVATAPCRLVRSRLAEPLAVVRSVAGLALSRATSPPDARADAPGSTTASAPIPNGALTAVADRGGGRRTPDAGGLPIEEYQSLAASQVVARLDGLTAGELDRVRQFEAAHRGRRTVLGKVDQLLAER